MRCARTLLIVLLSTLPSLTTTVRADELPIAWATAADTEHRLIRDLLESEHWPFRVFAMMRLERFDGPEIEGLLAARLADEDWQARVFAIRALYRRGYEIGPEALADEADARVIRAALWCGYSIESDRLHTGARKLLRTRHLDELTLGLEIAAASDDERLRNEARRRVTVLVKNLDESVLVRINDRLARILGLDRQMAEIPKTMNEWRAWFESVGGKIELAAPGARLPRLERGTLGNEPFVATLDPEAFSRLLDYLGALRERNLQVAIAMDSTSSMTPMVNEARAGVENLVLFLEGLAHSMQMALVAYRDRDNPPVVEALQFSSDIDAMREFLFNIAITGGNDLPESVLEGLSACRELTWNEEASRQIVVVGDARPHDEDMYAITGILEEARDGDVAVHIVHVPQQIGVDRAQAMPRAQLEHYRRTIDDHNVKTVDAFEHMAQIGGGEMVTLEDSRGLVPAIMHLTIDRIWWPAFDDFYALYVEYCR